MGSRDSFRTSIHCPKCKKTGEVSEWQEDGWSYVNNPDTTISSVTEGFIIIKSEYQHDEQMPVKCSKCDILAK